MYERRKRQAFSILKSISISFWYFSSRAISKRMIIEVHLPERKNILQRASSFAILPTRTKAFMMVSKVLAPKARSCAKLYAHL